jgi:hypothetical protein
MHRCQFCEGEISQTARKCRHCGEWVRGGPMKEPRWLDGHKDESVGRAMGDFARIGWFAAKWYVAFTIIGFILFLLFFLFVWLPGFNEVRDFHRNF